MHKTESVLTNKIIYLLETSSILLARDSLIPFRLMRLDLVILNKKKKLSDKGFHNYGFPS